MENLSNKFGIVLLTFLLCFKVSSAIMCYNCTSELDKNCMDPFDAAKFKPINCTDIKPSAVHLNVTPVLCRKLIIKAYRGHKRYVRECGFVKSDRDDGACIHRSGSEVVSTTYCSCTKDDCNAATTNFVTPILLASSFIGAYLKFNY